MIRYSLSLGYVSNYLTKSMMFKSGIRFSLRNEAM